MGVHSFKNDAEWLQNGGDSGLENTRRIARPVIIKATVLEHRHLLSSLHHHHGPIQVVQTPKAPNPSSKRRVSGPGMYRERAAIHLGNVSSHLSLSTPEADTPSLPSFPTGADAPIFPIVMLCRSEDEYLKFSVLAPWVHKVAQAQCDTRFQIADALELLRNKTSIRATLLSERSIWPVFQGNNDRELITFKW